MPSYSIYHLSACIGAGDDVCVEQRQRPMKKTWKNELRDTMSFPIFSDFFIPTTALRSESIRFAQEEEELEEMHNHPMYNKLNSTKFQFSLEFNFGCEKKIEKCYSKWNRKTYCNETTIFQFLFSARPKFIENVRNSRIFSWHNFSIFCFIFHSHDIHKNTANERKIEFNRRLCRSSVVRLASSECSNDDIHIQMSNWHQFNSCSCVYVASQETLSHWHECSERIKIVWKHEFKIQRVAWKKIGNEKFEDLSTKRKNRPNKQSNRNRAKPSSVGGDSDDSSRDVAKVIDRTETETANDTKIV